MKLRPITLVLSAMLAMAGCGGSGDKEDLPDDVVPKNTTHPDPTADASVIAYNDMAVHDPSIIRADDGTYYVFGSHLAAAKSTDLMMWERVADGVDDLNPLFNTYSSEIAEGIEWVGGHVGSWAADVIQRKDGKYYFYYNHCANNLSEENICNAPRSYLGVAVSDDINGPYIDQGVFLRSGMSAEEIEQGYAPEGIAAYDGAVMPNAIDPDVFYDKNGNLWMVYGSYFGGIFILEMDEATGKPKDGQGYGKHLAGGGFAPIEGTWISYNPESDYYYMFNSIAGFDAAGGYNIRVSRSRNPDGPYLDAAGNDMVLARDNLATLSKYGVKLMGGFNFVSNVGDAGDSWGYLAPGHNSAIYDETLKKHLLVTHTRFPDRGEQHSVRVHEMWVNADGWLVASPQRYAPISGDNVVDAEDLIGDYRFINHETDSNTVGHDSIYIRLNDDRTITGEASGTYRLSDNNPERITLVIAGKTYEGVMAWQWDEAARRLVPTFSAVSTAGASVWGSQLPKRSTAEALDAIADALVLPENLSDPSLTLPLRGTNAATITWDSSNQSIINPKRDKKTGELTGFAKVNRPSATAGDQQVTMTATITLNGQTQTKTFDINVVAIRPIPALALFTFEGNLEENNGNFEAGTATGDRINNTGAVAYAEGWNGQAVSLNGTNGVLLPPGLISNYEYAVSFWIKPTALTAFTTAFFGAVDTEQWVSFLPQGWDGNTMLWAREPDWFDGLTGELIPANEWSNLLFSVDNGDVAVYINGERKFTGTGFGDLFSNNIGTFALGVNYWDIPFNGLIDDLKIYNTVLNPEDATVLEPGDRTPEQVLELAKAALMLGNISELKEDIDLPIAGPYTTAISWQSLNQDAMDNVGNITQPSATSPDAEVTLIATITYGGISTTKEFNAVVKSKAPPAPVAVFAFDENLDEQDNLVGPGTVVGNLVNVAGGEISYADGVVNAEGVTGNALVLDGTSGVLLPDNLINDDSYSISLWLNVTAGNQFTPALFGWIDTENWISLVPRGPGSAQHTMLWSGSTPFFDGTFGAQAPVATWKHLVMTVDNGTLKTYIDGVLTNTLTGFPAIFAGAGDSHFAIGVNFWDVPFTGMMDDLRFYDDVLTADDVGIVAAQNAAP